MITGPVSLKNPEVEYRAILSEDRCYFGKVLFTFDRGSFDARNPGKRDFFHPGVMMPRMARTLVNIAGINKGDMHARSVLRDRRDPYRSTTCWELMPLAAILIR